MLMMMSLGVLSCDTLPLPQHAGERGVEVEVVDNVKMREDEEEEEVGN